MSALARLQHSILIQSAEQPAVFSALSGKAKAYMAVLALAAAGAISPTDASAQNAYMNPSACADVGSSLGTLMGQASGGTDGRMVAIGQIIGGFFGGAAGSWACESKPQAAATAVSAPTPAPAPVYAPAPLRVAHQAAPAPAYAPVAARPAAGGSTSLASAAEDAVMAKEAWLSAARTGVGEEQARTYFEVKRAVAASLLNQAYQSRKLDGVAYSAAVVGAMMELPVSRSVAYTELQALDNGLRQRNGDYRAASIYAAARKPKI